MGNFVSSKRRNSKKYAEEFSKPTGLYATCPWSRQIVKKWIFEGKVAPRFPPIEDPELTCIECPICFLSYLGVNRSVCCSKPICTECYLQLCPPRSNTSCPFCNNTKFSIKYHGVESKTSEEIIEEQRVVEARMRALRASADSQTTNQRDINPRAVDSSSNASLPPISEETPSNNIDLSSGQFPFATVRSRENLQATLRASLQSETAVPPPTNRSTIDSVSNDGTDDVERTLIDLARNYGSPELINALSTNADIRVIEQEMLAEAMRLSMLEADSRSLALSSSRFDSNIASLDTGLVQFNSSDSGRMDNVFQSLNSNGQNQSHELPNTNQNDSTTFDPASITALQRIDSIPDSELGDWVLAIEMSLRDLHSNFQTTSTFSNNAQSQHHSEGSNTFIPPIPGNPFDIFSNSSERLGNSSTTQSSTGLTLPRPQFTFESFTDPEGDNSTMTSSNRNTGN